MPCLTCNLLLDYKNLFLDYNNLLLDYNNLLLDYNNLLLDYNNLLPDYNNPIIIYYYYNPRININPSCPVKIQWNPNFTNLQGKQLLVQVIGRFAKLRVWEIGIPLYFFSMSNEESHIISNLLTSSIWSYQGYLRPRPWYIDLAITPSVHQGLSLIFPCNDLTRS